MQTPTPTPTPALAPALPPPNAASVTITGADGKPQTILIPKTQEQVDLLVSRRSQISDQISSLNDRRSELVDNIRTAPDGVARTGVEERVRLLDQRLLGLESDLASTSSQLAMAAPELISIAETRNNPPSLPDDEFAPGMAVGGASTLAIVGALFLWRRFRRKRRPVKQKTQLANDSNERLERLEQGVEAIAIEVERISEGQRFVTKLLSDAREPIAAGRIPQSGSAQ